MESLKALYFYGLYRVFSICYITEMDQTLGTALKKCCKLYLVYKESPLGLNELETGSVNMFKGALTVSLKI